MLLDVFLLARLVADVATAAAVAVAAAAAAARGLGWWVVVLVGSVGALSNCMDPHTAFVLWSAWNASFPICMSGIDNLKGSTLLHPLEG